MAENVKMGEIEALHFIEDAESDDPEMMKQAFVALSTAILPYITDSPRSHSDAEFAWRMATALQQFMEGIASTIEMYFDNPAPTTLENADARYCADPADRTEG